MQRVHLSARAQIAALSALIATASVATVSVMQTAIGAPQLSTSIAAYAARQSELAAMEAKLTGLQARVITIKTSVRDHVARLEARQQFLAALLNGETQAGELGARLSAHQPANDADTAQVAAQFDAIDAKQGVMASRVRQVADERYRSAALAIAKLGFSANRFTHNDMRGIGGPYEPMPLATKSVVAPKADPQFRALFNSWRQLDQLNKGIVAIPSQRPVQSMIFTSGFGVRSDPFRGGRAMHAGVDIPGAHGTPIYATADGVVGRTGWIGGYGNLVELEHGKGIQTRYGHLSSVVVAPGTRIKRGQLIAMMGSTGRSTGTHLHYEVRIDGHAVNPVPFLQTNDYLANMQSRATVTALGGPIEKSDK